MKNGHRIQNKNILTIQYTFIAYMCVYVYVVRMFKVFHLLFPLTSTFSQIISFHMVRIITLKDAMPSLLNNLYCSICMWILCKRPDGNKYTILFRNMIHVFRPNFPVWFINFILFFLLFLLTQAALFTQH